MSARRIEGEPSKGSLALPRRLRSAKPNGVNAIVPRPAPLGAILAITFFGSVSGGAFWAGLFFVTARHYQFSPARNLVLAASMGALSAAASWRSGRLAARFPPRVVLWAAFALWAAVSLLPVMLPHSQLALWITAFVASATSATIWPIVESYVSAGRHGVHMRRAIGWFNVVWTPAMAVPLFLMPVVARLGLPWCLGLASVINVFALAATWGLPPRPAEHHADEARAAMGPEYGALAKASMWLLPLSYVISTTIAPLLPFRLAAVGVGSGGSMFAGLWMTARFLTFFTMWRTAFWHGRWGTLAAGSALLLASFAAILLAPTVVGLVAGLLGFGVGMGLIYYCALYYSLTVGHAAVEAGGLFEALVGLGSCAGPLVGTAGQLLGGAAHANVATLGVAAIVLALGAPGVLRPYFSARAARFLERER